MLNFPEAWSARVIALLTVLSVAPWLDGIPELDTEVIEVGSGAASEANVIHLPVENFKPEVLINNSSYPIALQAFTDTEATIQLDKYQTKVTTLSDDQIIGASYSRIDSATRGHVTQINSVKYKKAIHAIAPTQNTTATPVVQLSTWSFDVYKAIVALKNQFDLNEVPADGRRLVLCSNHYNALLRDRERFGNLLMNMNSGQAAPIIAGFEIYTYVGTPTYSSGGVKKAYGAVPQSGDVPASVAFWKENIAKKTGMTKQYFAKAEDDPENQTNKLNYRHYFIAVPAKNEAIGAIIGSAGDAVTGVTITNTKPMELAVDATEQIVLNIQPASAENKSVTFVSSDTGKATVSAAGLVKGIAAGSATITVTTVDGSYTDTITVNVS